MACGGSGSLEAGATRSRASAKRAIPEQYASTKSGGRSRTIRWSADHIRGLSSSECVRGVDPAMRGGQSSEPGGAVPRQNLKADGD